MGYKCKREKVDVKGMVERKNLTLQTWYQLMIIDQ